MQADAVTGPPQRLAFCNMTTRSDSLSDPVFIGVDVASKHLDAAVYGAASVKRLSNAPAAISAWLDKLPVGSRIGLESTGRYHEALASAAHAKGFTVYLLNPRDVRMYAKGMAMRGKTDRLDALILARYIAHEHRELRTWQPQPPAQHALDELIRRRSTIVGSQQALRMTGQDNAVLQAAMAPMMKELDKLLAKLDTMIAAAVKALSADSRDFECITSVPGIGLLSGSVLLGLFRRLSARSGDAVIAFLGMDPRPMDSGQKTGLRRMSKRGPAEWRRLLFNAAMSASRTKAWQAVYQRECAKGLPRVAALNVLARKIVRVAFGLFKSHAMFDAKVIAAK
jgi:transposase